MRTIHKYNIPFKQDVTVDIPQGAEFIRATVVDGAMFVWAVVDSEAPMIPREFHLYKTGNAMVETPLQYLGCGAIYLQMELMMYVFVEPEVT
jgi:hypothetical protein